MIDRSGVIIIIIIRRHGYYRPITTLGSRGSWVYVITACCAWLEPGEGRCEGKGGEGMGRSVFGVELRSSDSRVIGGTERVGRSPTEAETAAGAGAGAGA